MDRIERLEREMEEIKKRNMRVEGDKAWETSWTRKITITALTYTAIVIYFFFAGIERPFLNAIVPAIAFVLSTLSVGWLKGIWLRKVYRKAA